MMGFVNSVVGTDALVLSGLFVPFIFIRESYPTTPTELPVAISKSLSLVTKFFSPIL